MGSLGSVCTPGCLALRADECVWRISVHNTVNKVDPELPSCRVPSAGNAACVLGMQHGPALHDSTDHNVGGPDLRIPWCAALHNCSGGPLLSALRLLQTASRCLRIIPKSIVRSNISQTRATCSFR